MDCLGPHDSRLGNCLRKTGADHVARARSHHQGIQCRYVEPGDRSGIIAGT